MSDLESRVQRLEARNAALERSARRWRRGAGALAAVAALGVTAGLAAPKEKVVEATRLVIVDEQGKERASFGAGKDVIGLAIMDAAGQSRISIGTGKEGAGIAIKDEKGTLRLALGEGTQPGHGEGAGMWVFDENAKPRVGLGEGKDGQGIMSLDEKGQRAGVK